MADRVIFFTGFPGFIGRRLVARLLEVDRKARIAALVEERFAEQARAAADELEGERIAIVTGDIGDRRLGLDDDTYERLTSVSTAYVAGDRTGVVYEHELSLGQGFKNHYESTKFQAELWVRELMDRVPTTIYRPAIVVGDSRTGETQ